MDDAVKRRLLRLARQAAEADVRMQAPAPIEADWPDLAHSGAFVTMRTGRHLRGCIGTFRPKGTLPQTVQEMAVEACRDPRFVGSSDHGRGIASPKDRDLRALPPGADVRSGFAGGRHARHLHSSWPADRLLPAASSNGDAVGCRDVPFAVLQRQGRPAVPTHGRILRRRSTSLPPSVSARASSRTRHRPDRVRDSSGGRVMFLKRPHGPEPANGNDAGSGPCHPRVVWRQGHATHPRGGCHALLTCSAACPVANEMHLLYNHSLVYPAG